MNATHLLLLCALSISACSPAKESQEKAAAKRIDVGLMHDYGLANEQRTTWKSAALPALPQEADDTTFLRRACIDLAGRLPKPHEVRAFVSDKTTGKRARLANALIKEPQTSWPPAQNSVRFANFDEPGWRAVLSATRTQSRH